ncbi:MAG: DEAD/DEAH box helicase [Vicinamibacterales bacterium]
MSRLPTAAEVAAILTASQLPPVEYVVLPGREARFAGVPEQLDPRVRQDLQKRHPRGLYAHQAQALEVVLAGGDLCLATPTASGKSLVFMAAASHVVLQDTRARVLALYPAKALIQDQLTKWESALAPYGIRVAFIDGSVPVASRPAVLKAARVIAMTPDVAHAWLMSRVADSEVAAFLQNLRLLVLDEAHVYDGAFGTNMAYFLRRLAVASSRHQIICSTATVGAPADFMNQLTGRTMTVLDADSDGSAVSEKALLLARTSVKASFDRLVKLLVNLSEYGKGRFLAFGDSRKAVERIVAAVLRDKRKAPDDQELDGSADDDADPAPSAGLEHVLPFRAGYEVEDRKAIQAALTQGTLAGVVSTSALELGLDIGDLDIVVLLNTPSTVKAFRQRIGRAGRQRPGVCIILDDQGQMNPLSAYLERAPEPSWLYLENRYIQYSNALCAASELQARGKATAKGLEYPGLPATFEPMLENELNPTEAVPPDLYALKQKAQGNPHYEFPIRSAAEPNFTVEGPFNRPLGTLSYAQALREAYPGAIYYYMARPYRVWSLEFRRGKIHAKRDRYFTTKPLTDNVAFPNFRTGVLSSRSSAEGFVCEVELQVSERVKGFVEQRGQTRRPHEYGPDSPFSQRPLTRFFQTTGVCWSFPGRLDRSEAVAQALLQAFSWTCGIHERDLGCAFFMSKDGFRGVSPVQGSAIFDAVNGSLRLTERLASRFAEVVRAAIEEAERPLLDQLRDLLKLAEGLGACSTVPRGNISHIGEGGWVELIARGEPAMYMHAEGPIEVKVLDFRYTPGGILYQLEPLRERGYEMHWHQGRNGPVQGGVIPPPPKWLVSAAHIQPISGRSRMVLFNLTTGDECSPEAEPV